MTNAKRGRGTRHGVYVGAVAALGFALSGCGGGGTSGSSSAAAAATGSTTTQGTAPAQSASGSGAASGSAATGGTGSGSSTSAASTGSGSTSSSSSSGSTPPAKSSDSVTVNWTPPTENTNGSPLTNLAGYDIHYGTSSASLTKKISISNPGIATYVVSNLTAGKYYFAVAAVNSAGTESPLSAQVSATVTN
jgi:hypothetical protein